MTPVYATKLGFRPRPANVRAQKIDNSALETYALTMASFLLQDNQARV